VVPNQSAITKLLEEKYNPVHKYDPHCLAEVEVVTLTFDTWITLNEKISYGPIHDERA